MNRTIRTSALAVLLAAALAPRPPAAAQGAPPPSAPKSGTVVWYTTLEAPTLNAVVARFEQTHPGITLEPLRLGSAQLPPRIITEERGGKYNADVVDSDDFQFRELLDAGALARFTVPEPRTFLPGSLDPNGLWATLFYATTVIAWNAQKVKADGLKPPASLADLAQPQWKGKIGIDSDAYNWYGATLATQRDAAAILKGIAANQPLITSGHTVSVAQLESGEFDVTPTAYGYTVDHERALGRPIAFVNPRPTLITRHSIGLAKDAPHPEAAHVFLDWILSRAGQTYLAQIGDRNSARKDVATNRDLFDPRRPYYVFPAPDPAQYASLIAQFKELLGTH